MNQLTGKARDSRGRFVKGNPYRIVKERGTVWFPNGFTPDGRCYNQRNVKCGNN